MVSLFILSVISVEDITCGIGEMVGSGTTGYRRDPVDLLKLSPLGEHADNPTTDLLPRLPPCRFCDSSVRRGTRGGRGGGSSEIKVWNTYKLNAYTVL